MRVGRCIELGVTAAVVALVLCPELAEPRTWWYVLMTTSREGARRCGQVALMAERRYRAEVAH